MKAVRIVTGLAAAIAAVSVAAPPVDAAPGQCNWARVAEQCGAGDVHYCPDTGQWGSIYQPCPSMIVGPYSPGGLQPNQ